MLNVLIAKIFLSLSLAQNSLKNCLLKINSHRKLSVSKQNPGAVKLVAKLNAKIVPALPLPKKKKKGKLFSTGQNSTAEVICFDADTQRLSGKTNSDTFFQSTF